MNNLKDDKDFLEEVLEKIVSPNLHDKMEGTQKHDHNYRVKN